MNSQSPGIPTGSPGEKSHLDVASAERCREYYMGEGGGFPRVRAVVSLVCQSARGLCVKMPKCELTTLWFVLDAESSLIY
jgi:hypothetical protein